MTGPEHYREAERALEHAEDGAADWEWHVAVAQVHATLALAAATALAPTSPDARIEDHSEWKAACAAPYDPTYGRD